MMTHHFRKIAILLTILMIVLVACGPQETETPEPTDEPVATEEVVATEIPTDEPTEVPTDEPTEVPTDEPTEAPTDEPTEAPTEADDMSGDMTDMAVVTYDNGAGFTFDYPEGYEARLTSTAVILINGDQRLIVISPEGWNTFLVGEREGQDLEQQLTFFVRRLRYTPGDTSEMMMADASISIESRSGLVGFANLLDLGDDNVVVVLELGPDAENVPSADGAVIANSVAYGMDMSADTQSADEMSDDSDGMDEESDDMDEETLPTILGLALGTENLSTLTEAVVAARLFSVLNGDGPLTVFAPTDDAFAAVEGLDELDRDTLTAILTYHVVEGSVLSTDLEDGQEVETLNGAILTVGVSDDGVTLTDAAGSVYTVIAADVMASNGVVHIIDGVLMPSAGE